MKSRFLIIRCIVGIALAALIIRTGYLQIFRGSRYLAISNKRVANSVVVKAPRGEIYDRNGKPMVSNRIGYALQFLKTDKTNDEIYEMLLKCLDILAESGYIYQDSFPVDIASWDYRFGDDNGSGSAEDERTSWFKERKNGDKKLIDLNDNMSARELFDFYKRYYKISDDYSEYDVRRIIGLRYDAELAGGFSTKTPFTIASDVDINVVTKIKERGNEFDGISVVNEYVRNYNMGTLAAHVLGRMGKISPDEYERLKDKGYGYNEYVGKQGVEGIAEEYLHGTDGSTSSEQNINGNNVKLIQDVEPIPGNFVVLTIDSDLQSVAEESLSRNIETISRNGKNQEKKGGDANAGAVVVIDIKNGDLLTMASYPTYDPSTFNRDYAELNEDKDKPMFNRALGGTYTPGSTFKPLSAIAAIESGNVGINEIIECKGIYAFYKSYQPRCWIWTEQHRTHGKLNVSGAIENSCNYFFYEAGRRMGIETLDEYAKKFGLGELTGLEFGEEVRGNVASPALKEKIGQTKEDKTWYGGDTIQAAIGQSDSTFTPIQLANYIATIANGGTRYKTNIIKSVRSSVDGSTVMNREPQVAERINMSAETVEAVKNGMRKVVEEGSASQIFENYPLSIGGKTGTAQVGTKVSNNALFVAFAPFENPEIAVCVVIEHGVRGANAANVARDIFDEYFNINHVNVEDNYTIGTVLQ
ncbi:MAG: penicillin-binding protein 2 [Oscillospiraceae bacterium]|nr:penicillin-binding protein 2 [Oscillospiraceae bacterium]